MFAHPYFERSTANAKLIRAYQEVGNVSFRDLYEEYPDFNILLYRERKRLPVYDKIVFHMPLIWFGMPPLLKLWIDEVFDTDWLNHSHSPLNGMRAYIVVTAGGSEQSFSSKGIFESRIKDFMSPLIECLKINNMKLEKFIAIHNADKLSTDELGGYYNAILEFLKEE